MPSYNEKVANAEWDNLTSGQKESMVVLTKEAVTALENGGRQYPRLLDNLLQQTSGVLSNPRGNFQNIGGQHSSSDIQNRVPAPCTDTKALAEATDHGRKPLQTPTAISATEFESLKQMHPEHSVANTNQSLVDFTLREIKKGGEINEDSARELLKFIQAHNQFQLNRESQNKQNTAVFNSQSAGHGL